MTERAAAWTEGVLAYWFRELGPESWFNKSDHTDASIRARFLTLYETIAADVPDVCFATPEAALAGVLVLDQFPRNMFRGSPRSFAADPAATMLATHAVARGFDRTLGVEQRFFLYLPFEHAESLALQERAVRLISALANPVWTEYAERHKAVIARFGRFPHRNAALARATTAEEALFLLEPGSAF